MQSRTRDAFIAFFLVLASLTVGADEPAEDTGGAEIWLVTYGPGEIYWQRFGHNAIWIRDPRRGLDHVFNFGFFDFAQENFLLRFVRGRMLYFSAARPAGEEFAAYIDENRSIRAQRLALSASQKEQLAAYLLNEVRPENRDYRYDYYRNNCSTRVRDALDAALGGRLSAKFETLPAGQTWREHTRRLTADDFWLYLGLEIVLGAPVDAATNAWEEMFIPALLAEAVALMAVEGEAGAVPLVPEDVMLYESSLDPPSEAPRAWWPRYLLASLVVVFAAGLLSRWAGPGPARGLARSWFFVSGTAGLLMLFFWFGTDHTVASLNLNLLVLNPLWLWPAFAPRGDWRLPVVVAGFSLLALLMPFLPPQQYTLDVLAAFLPLNLAAAAALGRAPAGAAKVRG